MLGRSHENPLDNQHVVTLDKLVVRLFIDKANDGNLWLATGPVSRFQTLKSAFEGCSCKRPFLIPLLPLSYLMDAVFLWKPQTIRVFMGSGR